MVYVQRSQTRNTMKFCNVYLEMFWQPALGRLEGFCCLSLVWNWKKSYQSVFHFGPVHTGHGSTFSGKFARKSFDVVCKLCEHSHWPQCVPLFVYAYCKVFRVLCELGPPIRISFHFLFWKCLRKLTNTRTHWADWSREALADHQPCLRKTMCLFLFSVENSLV